MYKKQTRLIFGLCWKKVYAFYSAKVSERITASISKIIFTNNVFLKSNTMCYLKHETYFRKKLLNTVIDMKHIYSPKKLAYHNIVVILSRYSLYFINENTQNLPKQNKNVVQIYFHNNNPPSTFITHGAEKTELSTQEQKLYYINLFHV